MYLNISLRNEEKNVSIIISDNFQLLTLKYTSHVLHLHNKNLL